MEYVKLQNTYENRKTPTKDQGYTLEEIMMNNWNYARRLEKGFVYFDIDDKKNAEIINKIIIDLGLKCKRLTTDRGYHFLFKTDKAKITDGSHGYNWLGIEGDCKGCGIKDTKKPGIQAIKVMGKQRLEEYLGGISKDNDIQLAPKWLYKASKNRQIDLTTDQTGSRNSMFHGDFMIEAKKAGFSYEEYQLVAELVNDYVLPEGLPKDELSTAIRQEEWDKLAIGEDKLTTLDKAIDVIEKWNCVYVNSDLMFFDEELKHYSSNIVRIECYIQEKYSHDNISKNGIKEVMDQMNIQLNNYTKYHYERNNEYIVCKDKLVSMWKDEVKDMTRTIVTDVVYPYRFMTMEECEKFDGRMKSFLNEISCGRDDVKRVMLECVGCMIAPTNNFGKIFIWYGSGENGKSKLMEFVQTIMGDLCTSANLLRINDDFALQGVMKGICNITDDIGTSPITETGLLKSVIQGSPIEVRRKYRDPIKWKPNTQFVAGSNNIPQIKDTSGGMTRRLTFVPFDLHLAPGQRDNDLAEKIYSDPDNLSYLMSMGIYAFRDAKKRGKLTELDVQKELQQDFIEENKDQINAFYDYIEAREGENSIGLAKTDMFCRWLDGKTADEMYGIYKEWCNDLNSNRIETQLTFSRRFKKILPSTMTTRAMKISGKTFNVYCFR